jgi:hypothetical protein
MDCASPPRTEPTRATVDDRGAQRVCDPDCAFKKSTHRFYGIRQGENGRMEPLTDSPAIPEGLDEQNAAIARRAYEISQSDAAGSPEENWWRAAAEINAREEATTSG